MKMWVDADACPRDAKDVIFRTAKRLEVPVDLIANGPLRVPKSPWIKLITVGHGFDMADDYIVGNVQPGEVVITADIPLAARIVERGAYAIDPRGRLLNEENVQDRLATRNLLAELRDQGLAGGGPPPYRPKDKSKFASALDRLLTKLLASQSGRPPA